MKQQPTVREARVRRRRVIVDDHSELFLDKHNAISDCSDGDHEVTVYQSENIESWWTGDLPWMRPRLRIYSK
jgi:hypothetical protein